MLAQEIILDKLQKAYVRLLKQQIDNKKVDRVDTELDCNIALAYSLINIYPWLEAEDLDDWRDRVEDICDCDLPCVNCAGNGDNGNWDDGSGGYIPFDPTTMVWIADDYICEDVDTIWIADVASIECEDDGITTTVLPTTTQNPFPTTTQLQLDCRNNVNFIYKSNAPGPIAFDVKYKDCSGIQRIATMTKGLGTCLSFISGTISAVDPANQQYMDAGKFSIGIYPCGTND